MKGKIYTIQIIPEDSEKTKSFRISGKWFVIGKIALVAFIVILGAFIFNLVKINHIVANYEKMKVRNAQLIKKDNNYEEMFSRLDSLWVLEARIQNIFETYIENDSNKINSIIDKNRFAHTPEEKINVDYEGIHGWQPLEEKIKLEHIPSILPVVGIISQKYNGENDHMGIDFSAQAGTPVYAAGSGTVDFAGDMDELGKTIVIDHGNGYKTSYSHLKDIKVRKGRQVHKGDIIGSVGNTGTTSGPHLHYSVTLEGTPINPEDHFNY